MMSASAEKSPDVEVEAICLTRLSYVIYIFFLLFFFTENRRSIQIALVNDKYVSSTIFLLFFFVLYTDALTF